MKHLESRDPQSGKPDQIEVLMEVELEYPTRPNDLMEGLQLKGFDVGCFWSITSLNFLNWVSCNK